MTLYQINLPCFLWLNESSYSLYPCVFVIALNRTFFFHSVSLLKMNKESKFLSFTV